MLSVASIFLACIEWAVLFSTGINSVSLQKTAQVVQYSIHTDSMQRIGYVVQYNIHSYPMQSVVHVVQYSVLHLETHGSTSSTSPKFLQNFFILLLNQHFFSFVTRLPSFSFQTTSLKDCCLNSDAVTVKRGAAIGFSRICICISPSLALSVSL